MSAGLTCQPGENKRVCCSCSSSPFLPASQLAPCLPWVQRISCTLRCSETAGAGSRVSETAVSGQSWMLDIRGDVGALLMLPLVESGSLPCQRSCQGERMSRARGPAQRRSGSSWLLDHGLLDGCSESGGRPGEGVRRALGPCGGSDIRCSWSECWRLGTPKGRLSLSSPTRPLSPCPAPLPSW